MSCACFIEYGIYDEKLAKIVSELLKNNDAFPKSHLGETMLGWICENNNVVTVTRDLMDIGGYGYNVFEKLEDDCDCRTAKQIADDEKRAMFTPAIIKSFSGFFAEGFLTEDVSRLITNAVAEGGAKCSIYVDQTSGYDTGDFGCDAKALKAKREEWATKQAKKTAKAAAAKKSTTKKTTKTTSKTAVVTYDTKIYEITKQGVLKKYKGAKKADIEIPAVVKKINAEVFKHYGLVKNITIPESVVEIGKEAFAFCNAITEIVIPDSVTIIGAQAFSASDALSAVKLGASVSDIGDRAFYGCEKLSYIEVSTDNKNYKSIDGNLYSKDGKTLIYYAGGNGEDSFEIPEGVEVISDFAFARCKKIKNITIPESLIKIGTNAFEGCKSLRSINALGGITTIGAYAFRYCESLKKIDLPETLLDIGIYAFEECTGISQIVIPKSITTIAHNVFYSCPNISVYCEVGSKPDGWSKEWDEINSLSKKRCAVTWGYKE